jgi:hypothetical protein
LYQGYRVEKFRQISIQIKMQVSKPSEKSGVQGLKEVGA